MMRRTLLFLLLALLTVSAAFWAHKNLSKNEVIPSALPSPSATVSVPGEIREKYVNGTPIQEAGLSAQLALQQIEGDRILAVAGNENDLFAIRQSGSAIRMTRYQRGSEFPLAEQPKLGSGIHNLRLIYKRQYILVEIDGTRAARPVIAPGYDRIWIDTALGEVVMLETPRFADNFSRAAGNGEWKVESGDFSLRVFDYSDMTINPGFLTATVGTGTKETLDEEELLKARVAMPAVGLGIMTVQIFNDGKIALLIGRISGNSPASLAGLDENDVITSVNGRSAQKSYLDSLELRPGNEIVLTVSRKGQADRSVTLVSAQYSWGAELRKIPLEPSSASSEAVARIEGASWVEYFASASIRLRGDAIGGLMVYTGTNGSIRVYPKRYSSEVAYWVTDVYSNGKVVRSDMIGGKFPDLNSWFTVTLKPYSIDSMELYVDHVSVGTLSINGYIAGGIGVFAEGNGEVDFDDIRVGRPEEYLESWRTEKNLQTFGNDTHMMAWAVSPRGSVSEGMFWLDDGPFGDCEVNIASHAGFSLNLFSPDRKSEGITATYEPHTKRLIFSCDGNYLSEALISGEDAAKGLEFLRQSGTLYTRLSGKIVHKFQLPDTVSEGFIGMKSSGSPQPGVIFNVSAPNLVLDDFTGAPTEWRELAGLWGVTTRWSCDPRWAYYGGYSDDIAMIQSKFLCHGDRYADFYIAPPMISHQSPWEKRSDILVGLSTSQTNPYSGYFLHIGGDCDRWTTLYRDGKSVATYAGRLFADTTFEWDNVPVHKWYRIRLEITGGTVRFFFNGREILKYTDPSPYENGRPVIGTLANGILLSKMHIYGKSVESLPAVSRQSRGDFGSFTLDRSSARASVKYANETVTVTPLTSCGVPVLSYTGGDVCLDKTPYLHFFFSRRCIPVDLYFDCNSVTCRLSLSGEENESGDAESVGHLYVEDTGASVRVEFDLKGALSRYFPKTTGIVISNIRFGCSRYRNGEIAGRYTPGGFYSVGSFMLRPYASNMLSPAVEQVLAPYDDPSLGETLCIKIMDPSNGNLNPENAIYRIDGNNIFYDGRTLYYDRVFRRLVFDLARLEIGPGTHTIEIESLTAKECGTLEKWHGEFEVKPERDDIPPSVDFDSFVLSLDFEGAPLGVFPAEKAVPLETGNFDMPFTPRRLGAGFVNIFGDAARGIGFLRVFNRGMGGSFGLGLLNKPIEPMYSPLFAFRFRSDRPIPLDLVLKGDYYSTIASISPYLSGKCDGKWHDIVLDLRPFLREGATLNFIAFADSGYQGVVRGEHYDIDSVSLMKVISTFKMPLLRGFDISGPVTINAGIGTGSSPATPIADLNIPSDADGITEFCYSATDLKGNRTVTFREYLYFDSMPPEIQGVERRGDEVTITLKDNYGIVPNTVYVQLDNGYVYSLNKGLQRLGRFDFVFEWPSDEGGDFTVFASDYAGNRLNSRASVEGVLRQ